MNNKKLIGLSFLIVLGLSGLLAIPGALAATDRPLMERVQLGTYSITCVDSHTTKYDYMLVGKQIYFPCMEYIDSGDGETAVNTATSYVDLSKSCILGDYASEHGLWNDYAFIQDTFSGTETEAGDTACGSGNITDPSLSAGSTSTYISCEADFANAAADGGTAAESVTWAAEVWRDLDDDGTDDTSTVPEEDYIVCTKDVYIYYCLKVDASDTDTTAFFSVSVFFYVDASTTYEVEIVVAGGDGAAAAYAADWDYSGTSKVVLTYQEAENEAVAGVISLAEVISDDGESPAIAGIDYTEVCLSADDNYGAGDTDTVTGYLYNLAIFDEPPAINDNDPATDLDDTMTNGNEDTAIGDATYYASHNILIPYTASAADTDWDTLIYLDSDIYDGRFAPDQELTNVWHQIYFAGTAEMLPKVYSTSINPGVDGTTRNVDMLFDFNQRRISDATETLSSTWAPSFSTADVYITTDEDVFRGDAKEFHLDIIDFYVEGVKETDDAVSNLVNTADDTDTSLFQWSTAPSTGEKTVQLSYYCSLIDVGSLINFDWVPPIISGNLLLIGIGIAVFWFIKRRR